MRNFCGRVPSWKRKFPITPPTWSLELQKLEGHTNSVSAVAFSLDGSLLASTSYDRIVKLWNPTTSQEVQKLEGHTAFVTAVAFSPDGSLLASASNDQAVRLWNPTTGQEVQKLEAVRRNLTLNLTNDNKVFLTNRETVDIEKESIPVPAPESSTNQTLMIKDSWIRRGSRNLLWLPQEYRSGCSTFRGKVFAFGLHSGQVSFIELSFPFQSSHD